MHHGQYVNYFERGRVELLRNAGQSYKDFEAKGLFLVVAELNLQYHAAAVFDDLLTLTTSVEEVRRVRIRHRYELVRKETDQSETLIVTGSSLIACVDQEGKVKPLPRYMREL